MGDQLTQYAIWDMIDKSAAETADKQFIVQVMQVKLIGAGRYKVKINDGTYFYASVLCSTQLAQTIKDRMCDTNLSYLVRIKNFLKTENSKNPDCPVIVIVNMDVIRSLPLQPLGSPVDFDPSRGRGNPRVGTHAAPGPSAAASATSHNPSAGAAPQPSVNRAEKRPNDSGPQQPAKRPAPSPMMNGSAPSPPAVPIMSLNPFQNKWCICARVTAKSQLRHYSNSRGEGDVFSVDLQDESGEIKATGFNAEAIRFHPLFEVNRVYYIRGGSIRPAKKQFTSITNDYEIHFGQETQVTLCEDTTASRIPKQTFKFTKIADLPSLPANKFVDVVGVVKHVGDLATVIARQTQKELTKRDLHLVDDSGAQVTLTLWGAEAENIPTESENPVLVIRGARTSDFGNACSLSAGGSSVILFNPTDVADGHRLRAWFDAGGGRDAHVAQLSSLGGGGGAAGGSATWSMIGPSRVQNLGYEKPEYLMLRGTVISMKKDNCMYQACPSAGCNKKVIDGGNGMYRCEKCNKDFPEFNWRYIMSICVADMTDSQWIMCFNEAAEVLLGKSADDLAKLKEEDEDQFNDVFARVNYGTYSFKCRAKSETFNEETRVRYTALAVLDGVQPEYDQFLRDQIQKALQS